MRRGNEPALVESENLQGTTTGIYFGADFCAEHEMGISDLRHKLGIPEKGVDKGVMGFKACTVGPESFNDNVVFGTFKVKGTPHAVMKSKGWANSPVTKKSVEDELHIFDQKRPKARLTKLFEEALEEAGEDQDKKAKANETYAKELAALKRKEGIAAAWSSRDFGVHVEGDDKVKILEEFYKAGCAGEIVVLICNPMPENPFTRGALTFMRLGVDTEMDKVVDQALISVETDARSLEKAFAKTKIEARLRKANKDWFALSPKWVSDNHNEKAENSEYPFTVWLNPNEQHKYNSRWCTVEELEQWIDEKGPIVKAAKEQQETDPGIFETS